MQYSAKKKLQNNVAKIKIHFFMNDASYHHITSTWKFGFGDNIQQCYMAYSVTVELLTKLLVIDAKTNYLLHSQQL